MAKSTKYFDLFSALKAGGDKGVSPEALQKATGFNQGALAVYIHALRNKFGAKIDSVRDGRNVIAYRLTNADEVKITAARKSRSKTVSIAKAVAKAKRTGQPIKNSILRTATVTTDDGAVAVPDADLDITEYTDNDLADIRQSLGI